MAIINYDKIKGLVYTEKSNKYVSDNKYSFRVDSSCTKNDVKSIIKSMFKVDTIKINIINVSGKTKRFKGMIGKRNSYKKAIVTVKSGQSINFQDLK